MLEPMRSLLGLGLAVVVVAFAALSGLVPGIGRWRMGVGLEGWRGTVVICGVLILAGLLLPPTAVHRRVVHATGLTIAGLLLLEPFVHLLILAVSTVVTTSAGAEALLPLAPPAIGGGLMLPLLVFVVFVPVSEEFFFRGRLLPWLQGRLGAFSAVTLSAGGFAAAHGDLVQALVAVPIGLLLGILRVQGAGLGACILAHAVHNGLFLLAGPGLIGFPLAAPVLVMAGAVVAAVAWHFQVRPRPDQLRRCIVTVTLAASVLVVAAPWWRSWQDRWWAAGVHRLCQRWRIDTGDLLARILAQERQGRLTPSRRNALVGALVEDAGQTAFRQCGLIALMDPTRLVQIRGWEDGMHELFDHLAARPPIRYDGELARRLAMVLPAAMADVALQWPEILPRWLPLPERSGDAALLLASCPESRDRRVLLAQLERMFPGEVAAVIFALPSAHLTAIERRHFRRHYGDADARIIPLAALDPDRARALGWHPTPGVRED